VPNKVKFLFHIHSLDGTCRHVAAVLYDLEHTARVNDLKSCTSGECQWIECAKPNTNTCLLQNLKLTELEYGEQEKTYPTVENLNYEQGSLIQVHFAESSEMVCKMSVVVL